MTQWTVVVPALHVPRPDGGVDMVRTRDYATAAATSWVDLFLVNGSTTGGRGLSSGVRAAVLDIWVDAVGPDRLLACSWNWPDVAAARARGVQAMAVMTPDFVGADVLRWLGQLPPATTIYSHPSYGGPVWTPEVARAATAAEIAPVGGKISKVSLSEVAELHQAAPQFALWDGSARHIRRSLDAGAAGVVLTPLSGDLDRLPPKSIEPVQEFVNGVQEQLDQIRAQPDRWRLLLDRLD